MLRGFDIFDKVIFFTILIVFGIVMWPVYIYVWLNYK